MRPPTRKSGEPRWEPSSAPSKLSAMSRKSSASISDPCLLFSDGQHDTEPGLAAHHFTPTATPTRSSGALKRESSPDVAMPTHVRVSAPELLREVAGVGVIGCQAEGLFGGLECIGGPVGGLEGEGELVMDVGPIGEMAGRGAEIGDGFGDVTQGQIGPPAEEADLPIVGD